MWVKLLLLFFVFSFLFRTDHSFDQDLGRHIKLGEIIWQSKEVPKTNLFSYTNPNFPFINTHWFFEVLVYGINQSINLGWILVFKIFIFLLSVWLIIKTIPKENQVFLLPIGFIFLHVLRERLELRPEIFSFLFTASTLFILERYLKSTTKWIFLLPAIQLIWINTHIYFFVGLMLQVTYIIYMGYQHLRYHLEEGKLKLLFAVFMLSAILSLLNPNGLQGILYPLNVTKNYGYTIVENQTMFLLENIKFSNPNFLFVKISLGLVVLSILVAFLRHKLELKNILLIFTGAALALLNVRGFPYLVFLSLPAVLQNLTTLKSNRLTYTLSGLFAILLILESYFYLNGDYYKYRDDQHKAGLGIVQSVKGGMDFVLANDLPGPIYNNFDIGSYILYRGYPKYKVFVDGRPEAYPASFFHQVYIPTQSDYSKFKDLEAKYNFKTIIFSHTDQTPWGKTFLQSLLKDETWKLIYIDNFMMVFVNMEVASNKNLPIIDRSKLSPNQYSFNNHRDFLQMGIFLLNTQNIEAGKQFIERSLQIFPQSPIANSILGNPTSNKFFW